MTDTESLPSIDATIESLLDTVTEHLPEQDEYGTNNTTIYIVHLPRIVDDAMKSLKNAYEKVQKFNVINKTDHPTYDQAKESCYSLLTRDMGPKLIQIESLTQCGNMGPKKRNDIPYISQDVAKKNLEFYLENSEKYQKIYDLTLMQVMRVKLFIANIAKKYFDVDSPENIFSSPKQKKFFKLYKDEIFAIDGENKNLEEQLKKFNEFAKRFSVFGSTRKKMGPELRSRNVTIESDTSGNMVFWFALLSAIATLFFKLKRQPH